MLSVESGKIASMEAKGVTPILNVSNIQESFAWFEKLGWKKAWDWGDPPTFGGVCSGKVEIFLCENGQGAWGVREMHVRHPDGHVFRISKGRSHD